MNDQQSYHVSSDKSRLDMDMLHDFLSNSYWSLGLPREVMNKAIENSVCFGAYDSDGNQVGFGRAATDKATFAYLADVFVLEPHRGKGVSKLIMDAYMSHPDLQGIRRHMLATSDAHGLYKKYGFESITNSEILMQKHNPDVYKK